MFIIYWIKEQFSGLDATVQARGSFHIKRVEPVEPISTVLLYCGGFHLHLLKIRIDFGVVLFYTFFVSPNKRNAG